MSHGQADWDIREKVVNPTTAEKDEKEKQRIVKIKIRW